MENKISQVCDNVLVNKNDATTYLTSKFYYVSDRNTYHLRNDVKGNIILTKQLIQLFKKSIPYYVPFLWNNLPSSLKNIENVQSFKYKISDEINQLKKILNINHFIMCILFIHFMQL